MDQMLNAYYTITAESEFRERERLYAKARHDEAQALHHAKQKGIEEGLAQGIEKGMAQGIEKGMAQGMAQGMEKGSRQRSFEVASNLKSMGMPFDQISQATGLTHAEIEAL